MAVATCRMSEALKSIWKLFQFCHLHAAAAAAAAGEMDLRMRSVGAVGVWDGPERRGLRGAVVHRPGHRRQQHSHSGGGRQQCHMIGGSTAAARWHCIC
jgi:hypothetical protein